MNKLKTKVCDRCGASYVIEKGSISLYCNPCLIETQCITKKKELKGGKNGKSK
jgi:hypothetical protein